jgi:hypothetical protein
MYICFVICTKLMQYKVVKYGIRIVIVNIEGQIVKNRYININININNSINNYKVNKTKHKDIKQNNYKYYQLVDRLLKIRYKHNQIISIIHINKQLLLQIIKDIQKIIKI